MKTVKVARVGTRVQELIMNDYATVGDCLTAAGIAVRINEDVYVNHIIASFGAFLFNNSVIVVETKKAKVTPVVKNLLDILDQSACLCLDQCIDEYDNVDYQAAYEEYQELVDDGLLQKRRGVGMYVAEGAKATLLAKEQAKFLETEIPLLIVRMERLGISKQQLIDLISAKNESKN